MPVGTRMVISSFDNTKKSGWLVADLNGFVYTWGASIGIGALVTLLFYAVTGILIVEPLIEPLTLAASFIEKFAGHEWMILVWIVTSMLPSFLVVFVFRCNFTVIGPRRQFRYLCRWF